MFLSDSSSYESLQHRTVPHSAEAKHLSDYERLLVVVNPESTQAYRIQKQLVTLADRQPEHGLNIAQIESLPDSEAAREQLARVVHEHDIIGVAGGDGTVSQTMRVVYELELNNPVLAMGGGNANDIARSLHSSAALRDPVYLLKTASTLSTIQPLRITAERPALEDEAAKEQRLAFAYFGLGITALSAVLLNEPTHRQSFLHKIPGGRALRETMTVGKSFKEAALITIEEPSGKQHRVAELLVANGPRMAKFMRLPVELDDPSSRVVEVRQKYSPRTAATLGALALGKISGKELPEALKFTADAPTGSVIVQADGEATVFPSGTAFTVERGGRGITVLKSQK